MIHFLKGDIFDSGTDAIVNPVNCVGVMGAGLAEKFKTRYPYNYIHYKDACKNRELKIGTVFTVLVPGSVPRFVVNFPTKVHWRDASSMYYIQKSLAALVKEIDKYHFKSIAMPKVGCGLGGLDWNDVKLLIIETLGSLEQCDVLVYE